MMREKEQIIGDKVLLRCIEMEDCTDTYVRWLNDSDVNKYLETRWTKQDIESVKKFVAETIASENSILFAIIIKASNKHIGNIKIGPVNRNHLFADVSYFIGDRNSWRKGYAKEAISLAIGYGFRQLGLHKICAGYYASNNGSAKALERNGFQVEGVFPSMLMNTENQWEDAVRVGLLLEQYQAY
jgi:[ribosomal protein S5]-alanine N-acetyltransferase